MRPGGSFCFAIRNCADGSGGTFGPVPIPALPRLRPPLILCGGRFTTIAFGSNGERIYWDTQFALHVWDGSSYEAVANYGGFGEILAISQDGGKILARRAHALSLIEAAAGTVLAQFKVDADNLESASLSNDGHRAATSSKDGLLRVWDLPSGTEIASIQSGPAARAVVVSPDGLRIAAAGY